MNYSIWVPLSVILAVVILSVIWDKYFTKYLEKNNIMGKENRGSKSVRVLDKIDYTVSACCLCTVCAILLTNTDEVVSETLDYVKPTKHIKGILEKK